MEWLEAVGEFWLDQATWLVRLGILFGLLVPFMPCNRGMRWWRVPRAVVTDFLYWFAVPLVTRNAHRLLLTAGLGIVLGEEGAGLLPLAELPLWQQCAAVLVIQDVLLYGLHRVFHRGWAWRFHAVHHAPKVLDWPAVARFHPVNHVLSFGVADLAVLLLGFSPAALVVLAPVNVYLSALVHANLNWTFGPFRYVIASPVFHRWHHTTQAEGRDKNFAPTFPLLDLVFGTFFMPTGVLPDRFGTDDPDFPEGFWGQLLFPFRRAPQPQTPAVDEGPVRRRAA